MTTLIAWLILLPTVLATVVTQTITTTAAPSSPSNSPSYTSDIDFQNSILNSTNLYRGQHNASALTWNISLATYAASYAKTCQFEHSGGPNGENLAEGYPDVTSAVDAWGNERAVYDFHNSGFSESTGHFTQLVWKNTTTFGCGRISCNGKNGALGWLLVCEYFPPGNVGGQYGAEVQGAVQGWQQCTQGAVCTGTASAHRRDTPWKWLGLVCLMILV